jgi:hypothetical protein
MVPRIIF